MDVAALLDGVNILSEIQEFPTHTVASAMKRYAPAGELNYRVEENEVPPALANAKAEAGWDFEMLLGRYDPNRKEAVIWRKGVEHVAGVLNVDALLIDRIVKYHEIAHGIHHLGLIKFGSQSENNAGLKMADCRFRAAPTEIKEQIAQIATAAAIRSRLTSASHARSREILGEILDTFFVMMGRQSAYYRLPLSVKTMDLNRLTSKLELILKMCDVGVFPTAFHIEGIIE